MPKIFVYEVYSNGFVFSNKKFETSAGTIHTFEHLARAINYNLSSVVFKTKMGNNTVI